MENRNIDVRPTFLSFSFFFFILSRSFLFVSLFKRIYVVSTFEPFGKSQKFVFSVLFYFMTRAPREKNFIENTLSFDYLRFFFYVDTPFEKFLTFHSFLHRQIRFIIYRNEEKVIFLGIHISHNRLTKRVNSFSFLVFKLILRIYVNVISYKNLYGFSVHARRKNRDTLFFVTIS